MRLLLDTHVLLWALDAMRHLAPAVRDILENPANEVFFSAASIWEIAIVAQAMSGSMRLFTVDPLLPPYSELVHLLGTWQPAT